MTPKADLDQPMETAPDQPEDSPLADHQDPVRKCPEGCGCHSDPAQPAPGIDLGGDEEGDTLTVIGLLADGALEVEHRGQRRRVEVAELADLVTSRLGGDPMHVDLLAELLACSDHRGLRAQVGPEQALAVYRQAVADYRGATGTAHTIVQFLLKLQPRARLALQEEASFVLGLENALEAGGPLFAHRKYLHGLEAFLHFLQAVLPRDFADAGVAPVIPAPGCFCLVCVATRYTDATTIGRVFSDADRVLAEASTGGLMIVPVKLAQYLRHAPACPQTLADEQVPCSCGLASLLVAA